MMYTLKRLGPEDREEIKKVFVSVFTKEPWCDDWSDPEQLDMYIQDLTGQGYSLTYGLFDDEDELIGISLGYIKHWYSGTEYIINELCIRTDRQGAGAGTFFIREIEKGRSVSQIAAAFKLDPELAEQICRLYLTHPGVDAQGIMTKMGL